MRRSDMGYIVPETITKAKKQLPQKRLDRLASDIEQLRKIRKEIKEATAYAKQLELKIKTNLGDAEEGTVNGAEAVRWQYIENYAWARFCEDNPGIAAEFMITKEVTIIDEAALKESEHANLLRAYQTRNFTIL
jgi:predicted phage-related endonuclease